MTHMSRAATLRGASLLRLRRQVRGEVITREDPGFDAARAVWNAMIDRRPAVIVRCASVTDVVAAVGVARDEDLLLAIRGGGHSFAGFGTCEGGMVLDLSPMKGIVVDQANATARAQPGLTWREFDRATLACGLATTGGLVSTTGISGFTLGGGIGWLMRRDGMAVDNLLSAEVVAADGTVLAASPSHHQDLLWGLRGGGGNFGVVTELEFRLHQVGPLMVAGAVFYPLAAGRDVLAFYREWTASVPDDLTTMLAIVTAPPFLPPSVAGTQVIVVAGCHAGALDEGMAAVEPIRRIGTPIADALGPMPYPELQTMFDESAPRGMRNYFKNAYLDSLDDQVIDALLSQATRLSTLHPLSALHLHHLGGAVDRVPNDATAFGQRFHPYLLNVISTWADPVDDDAQLTWPRETVEALEPYRPEGQYVNFLADATQDRVRRAYGPQTYARLASVKQRYDPTNLFRVNLNIEPTGDQIPWADRTTAGAS
jgi:FAD/FMN-containing dehydrogenase